MRAPRAQFTTTIASAVSGFGRLCLLILALGATALPAAASEPSAPAPILPDLSFEVAPCCASEVDVDPPRKTLIGEREIPEPSPLGEETLERFKSAALFDAGAPPAHQLTEAGGPLGWLKGAPSKALRVLAKFDGMNFQQAAHAGIAFFPPDTVVAASPSKVLEASNVALRLSERDGSKPQIRSLNNFFSAAYPPVLFDPKVYFDQLSQRFFIVALSVDDTARKSYIHLAVSRGADPANLTAPANWCNYRIPSSVGLSWGDFPGLGMNERWVAVTVNNFYFVGTYRAAFLYGIDKAPLVKNGGSCPKIKLRRYLLDQDALGQTAFTVQPAQHYSTNTLSGTPLFFVSNPIEEPVSTSYTLWRLVDRGGSQPVVERAALPGSDFYSLPPNAPQRGGSDLDTGDQRVLQVAYRNGTLWAVHTTGCNFGGLPGESCARVIGVRPTESSGQITFQENFGVGDGWFVWMPAIAVNARGDLAVAFQRSHSALSAGVGVSLKTAAEAGFETVQPLVNGRCGLDNFDGQRNRTGDYVGLQADPADGLSFWLAGEYSGKVAGQGCNWRTRIVRVGF